MDRLANLTEKEYKKEKRDYVKNQLMLGKLSLMQKKIDHLEAATPTIKYYTQHAAGASFGTKFEGLDVSSHYQSMLLDCIMQVRWES